MQGKITFGFRYCDNHENRLRGRVGSYSGWRNGTRAFKHMPSNKIPINRSDELTCIRYYDLGRMGWRSFKKSLFVVCSSFYSELDGQWHDTPEAAGFKRTWRNTNDQYSREDREDTAEEKAKRKKIEEKEVAKRERQVLATQKRLMKSEVVDGRIVFLHQDSISESI